MSRRLFQVGSALGVFILGSPGYALAQWVTWYQFGTQGSYVHQTAHILFGLAMVFFIYEIYQARLQNLRGFLLLIWAWVFLALWNLDAFVGHFASWTLENPIILGHGWGRSLMMDGPQTWLVYITKIDHFVLLVPAFYLFYRGLKALERESGDKNYD